MKAMSSFFLSTIIGLMAPLTVLAHHHHVAPISTASETSLFIASEPTEAAPQTSGDNLEEFTETRTIQPDEVEAAPEPAPTPPPLKRTWFNQVVGRFLDNVGHGEPYQEKQEAWEALEEETDEPEDSYTSGFRGDSSADHKGLSLKNTSKSIKKASGWVTSWFQDDKDEEEMVVVEPPPVFDPASTEVPHGNVQTETFGVVANVGGDKVGPFQRPGLYDVEGTSTGLLLPIGPGDHIQTQDHRLQLILKEPVLLSLDKRTSLSLVKSIDIHELILEEGRARIQLHDGAGLWTIRGRDMSLSLQPNSDVVVDMTGTIITRVFIISGGGYCMAIGGKAPILLKAGEHISIGLSDTHRSTPSDSTWNFLSKTLSFEDINNFGEKIAAAKNFEQRGYFTWPVSNKTYSGILCTHCGYGFDAENKDFDFCPQCHKAIRYILPEDIEEDDSWFEGGVRTE